MSDRSPAVPSLLRPQLGLRPQGLREPRVRMMWTWVPDAQPRLPWSFLAGLGAWAVASPDVTTTRSPSWPVTRPEWQVGGSRTLRNQDADPAAGAPLFQHPRGPPVSPLPGQCDCPGLSAGGRVGPLHLTHARRGVLSGERVGVLVQRRSPRRRAASGPAQGRSWECGVGVRWCPAHMDHGPVTTVWPGCLRPETALGNKQFWWVPTFHLLVVELTWDTISRSHLPALCGGGRGLKESFDKG